MIKRFTVTQLKHQLESFKTMPNFILTGTDVFLLESARQLIRSQLKQQNIDDHVSYDINNQTDWDEIYQAYNSSGLFASHSSMMLTFDNAPTNLIHQKLNQLFEYPNPDIKVILNIAKFTKVMENQNWFKSLALELVMVLCQPLDLNGLNDWIHEQCKTHSIQLESESIELLLYYYEGNLLALSQFFEQLILLYSNKNIGLTELQTLVQDVALFTPFQWIDAILQGKPKRALHIFMQLKNSEIEPLILMRTFQKEWLQLINVWKANQSSSIKDAFDQFKVWQQRRTLLSPIILNAAIIDLYLVLDQLMQLELQVKSEYGADIWSLLQALTVKYSSKIKSLIN